MESLMPILIVVLILFSMYRRMRRSIGFQALAKRRMVIRMTIFSIIGIVYIIVGFSHPIDFVYDAFGIIIGAVIGYYAIRTTSFERREDNWFYRTHPWIGIVLITLFVGRIAYRMYEVYPLMGTDVSTQPEFTSYTHDPITAIVMLTLITYYILYYSYLINKSKLLLKESAG